MDLFSPASLSAWQDRLNSSPRFAESSRNWAGKLLLVEEGANRSAWVVVGHGRCLEAREGTPADLEEADFVLSAAPATWDDLAAARETPAGAAFAGRLSLHKGSVLSLIPHARAAAELLAAVARESS